MQRMNRRYFLQLSGTAAITTFLSACGGSAAQLQGQGQGNKLRWWDHLSPLEPLHKEIFAEYQRQHPDVTVEYQLYNLPQLGQSLQLAFNSKQAPDVHAIASLNIPASELVANKWFTPLDEHISQDFIKRFPQGLLVEGLHTFGGKLYSFPLFSSRSHSTLVWFNKQIMADAGANPDTGPRTWDEFRQVALSMAKKGQGKYYGWIHPLQLTERLGTQISELAQTAGAPGDINWKTGEYTYSTEPYAQAIEFLLALQKDGSLFPASTSLDARTARARFTTGVAGMHPDGPWCAGVIKKDYSEFLDKLGVAQIPVPNASQPSYLHREPNGGDLWISSQSKQPEVAAQLLEQLNTASYYTRLAESMDQPPLKLEAVATANVHSTYKRALTLFEEIIRQAPSALAKNPAVAEVEAEMKDIRPNLGEIAQGALSDTIKDYKSELKKYSDKVSAERERALKAVQEKGTKVSLDDWVFNNWDPAKDYTADLYSQNKG